jgi:hypothetical protein
MKIYKFQTVALSIIRIFTVHSAMVYCCILGGPGGERIMDVVPRGTELELQLRQGVGQASHTSNNLHIKCTGVY